MRKFTLVMALIAGSLYPVTSSQAAEVPTVVSFEFTPKEIELTGVSTTVDFELVVSHPNGMENTSTLVTATGPRNSTIVGYLNRTNQIGIFDSKPVTFKGSITFPRNVAEGAYSIKANGVTNSSMARYQYSTGDITPKNFRTLVGAESALIVRNLGDANISYNMFEGPTYDTLASLSFKDNVKYNRQKTPILKVGESYNPNDYFETYVPNMPLKISTTTPNVCSTDGLTLKFLATGNCQFKVFTEKTKDYASQVSDQNVTITNARPKSTFVVSTIEPQQAKDLPKTLALPQVYSAAIGYVLPVSTTPSVCIATAFSVRLVNGGTCILTYQTPATTEYLESEIYKQVIEVARTTQSITFSLPATINLSAKTLSLSATASSGAPVTYSTKNPENCEISETLLKLMKSGPCEVVASQAGTSLIAPISLSQKLLIIGDKNKTKRITCVKNDKRLTTKKKNCPKGYKKVP